MKSNRRFQQAWCGVLGLGFSLAAAATLAPAAARADGEYLDGPRVVFAEGAGAGVERVLPGVTAARSGSEGTGGREPRRTTAYVSRPRREAGGHDGRAARRQTRVLAHVGVPARDGEASAPAPTPVRVDQVGG